MNEPKRFCILNNKLSQPTFHWRLYLFDKRDMTE